MDKFEGVVRLGGLYLRDNALLRPSRPWIIDLSVLQPCAGLVAGDVADFETAPDLVAWRLGDTPADPARRLQWLRLRDQGRTLLVSDRVLLMRISWDDLDAAGLVTGRTVTIDGRDYRCRLLTGGSRFRSGDEADGYPGGWPLANEWDRYVGAEAGIPGVPLAAAADLGGNLALPDPANAHNAPGTACT